MKRIEQLVIESDVLSTFITEHKGIVDDKTKGDLSALQGRVAAEAAAAAQARETIAVARTTRDVAFESLQDAVLSTRKAVELVVVRDKRGVKVPLLTDIINNPARIHVLAQKYLVAVAQAGKEPAVVKAGAALKAALGAYLESYNETYDRVSTTSEDLKEKEKRVAALGREVNAYKVFIASRSTPELRRELVNRMRARLPRKRSKGAAATTQSAVTAAAAATVQPPALPAIPATVLPPSSEHPVVSANA